MLQVLGVVAGLAPIHVLFTAVLGGDDGGETATPTGPIGPTPAPTCRPPCRRPRRPARRCRPWSWPGKGIRSRSRPGLSSSPSPGGGVGPIPTGPVGPASTITPPVTTVPPVVSIFRNERKLQVEVGGTVCTVEVGERFDDNFKLVGIDDMCAGSCSGTRA